MTNGLPKGASGAAQITASGHTHKLGHDGFTPWPELRINTRFSRHRVRFSRTFREGVRSIKRIPMAAVIYWQTSGHYDCDRRLLAVVRERHGHAEVPV